jgi:cytochrome c oxidase assembly protein subunit 15
MTEPTPHDPLRPVRRWLALLCLLILAMVAVGGITRLTESGLSMVTWEPILGAVPPLNAAQWQTRFEQYQQFPEYQMLKRHLTLAEFKWIFFWEYLHRLLGRFLGVAFLIPFAWFLATRRVRGALAAKLAGAFLLGGLQGFVGWWMVKSGLSENPYVSHYRLAVHLGLALLLLAALWWLRLDLRERCGASAPGLRRAARAFLALLVLQIAYGAFVAGLNAGFLYNTFPLMMGRVLPPGLDALQPAWRNLLDNATTVQFLHRALGWLMLAAATGLAAWGRARADDAQRCALRAVLALTWLQFALGVAALLLKVPVTLGVAHQVNAALLLLATVTLLHRVSARSDVTARPG